jgi:ABC-type dipeptide/oligopeptide/nickel transport system permease subunit
MASAPTALVDLHAEEPTEPVLGWRDGVSRALGNASVVGGSIVVLLLVLLAAVGPHVWRISPSDQGSMRLLSPSWSHPFGTDDLGRDELSRIIQGAQVSLEVSVVAVLIALGIGLLIGVSAGVAGGVVDGALMRVVDALFAFPGLVFAILMAGLLGPSQLNATVTIGVVFSPGFARVARGATLGVITTPFVEASRSLGARPWRIVRRDVLPNIAPSMITVTVIYISSAILLEAGLSFLGLGIQPPTASWGNMVSGARTYMQLAWWLPVFPGIAIALAVAGFNFLGDGLRDLIDPRSER